MDISNSLLVAIMFVMVLSLGIGAILTFLGTIVNQRFQAGPDLLHIGWVALLLLIHFNLFWHTIDLVSVEDWRFGGFLYAVAGPTLLFFATNVMLQGANGPVTGNLRAHFFDVFRRFLCLIAALQLWVIGADFILGRGFTGAALFNLATLTVVLVLTQSHRLGSHAVGLAVAWGLAVSSSALRGLGIIV